MFSSKKSTAMFASTSSKTDSSDRDRDRDDPPRPPVNRTVIKLCNRVAIPLSGLVNKISTEQESQVRNAEHVLMLFCVSVRNKP